MKLWFLTWSFMSFFIYLFTFSDFYFECSWFTNQKAIFSCQCSKASFTVIYELGCATLLLTSSTVIKILQMEHSRQCCSWCLRQKESSLLSHSYIVSAGANSFENLFSLTEVSGCSAKTPREKSTAGWSSAELTIWQQPSSLFASVRLLPSSLSHILFHYNTCTDEKACRQNKTSGFLSNS